MSDTTVYLKNYEAPLFAVDKVDLEFDLFEDHALVRNHMQLSRLHKGDLYLYGDDLELVSIELDNKPLAKDDYRLESSDLVILNCPDKFTLTIVTLIHPEKNTKLSGLYRSSNIFCTQCEAHGFRAITYFLDRPDVLSIYSTKITADKALYPKLLSNGNLVDFGDTTNGRHWVLWQDPFKKPSYLFALVAGNLKSISDEFITSSGRKVDLHIYVEPGNEDKCAHAMTSLKKSMRWDEEVFGLEYDLDIFMIVAVSDFNMGAMENKGLNIFNSKYILARKDTATDQDYADIEGVVGHEYFHNWTGNRVTCRDWFQLSLKEGLTVFRDQEFSRDMNSKDVCRLLDVKALRNAQFPEDAGSMAHPVRPESYEEINNFYTATIYNKGAEVIRMQETLLGKAGFRRGMDLYFKRHDGQAVTIDDFVAAMEDANNVDFSQFKLWYSQAGTPVVEVKSSFHDKKLTLTLTQSCPITPDKKDKKPFHIPIRIALFNTNGKELPIESNVLELKEKEQTFYFEGLSEKPIVSLLREFSAPIILQREIAQDELLALLRYETDGFAKYDAAERLALGVIKYCYNSERANWQIPAAIIDAYSFVLEDEALDMSLRAELLTPPSFEDVAASLNDIDVVKIEEARDFFHKELGRALFLKAEACYQSLWQQEDHEINGKAYGRRKLRNVCLRLMIKADEGRTINACQQQFIKAKTMTDQIAAFALLANSKDINLRQQAIDNFYQQWEKDELVLDKWFSIQASSDLPNTLDFVKKLESHKAFNFKNPNKVRALVGAFTQFNPRHFHAADGSGYKYLTEILLKMDKINPQIAARLATPFTRWKRLNEPRQLLIKHQLNHLATFELSRDLRELVMKSLG